MARESLTTRRQRAAAICQRLQSAYPNAHCELNYRNPLELLVATILSAQTTDQQVNRVTPSIFAKYATAADYACGSLDDLMADLRQIGLYRNKARNIQACCQALVREHKGQVPHNMRDLTALSGVGRKTANVILGNAFGLNEGIVVDTHVARLSQRLRLTSHNHPEKIEADLQALIPQRDWTRFSHWLIWHGRRRCQARRPDCRSCEVQDLCPSAKSEE